MKNRIVIFIAVLFLSCTPKSEKIEYGLDTCHYCKMNIVEKVHASEAVTKKGRVYKYDAIECMISDSSEVLPENVALYLVMDLQLPGDFIDARQASYLISEAIPSPMNAFLSAFKNRTDALEAAREHKGEVFSWEEIRNKKLLE